MRCEAISRKLRNDGPPSFCARATAPEIDRNHRSVPRSNVAEPSRTIERRSASRLRRCSYPYRVGSQSVYSAGMNRQEGAFVQDVTSQQDLCLTQKGSILRFSVLTLLFFTVLGGSVFLILFADQPYGIQLASIVIYTAAVALYTFSRNRNNAQPFLLSCPVVRSQIPRLIRRHLGFIAALFIAQTTALRLRPNLPAHWTTPTSRDASPFVIILGILCLCLAIVETLTNRSLLDRAHDSN